MGSASRLWWLRFESEVRACPACGSGKITLLEVIPRPQVAEGRVAFVTGCHGCGLLFTNPLPTTEHLQRYYSHGGPWAAVRAERMRRIKKSYRHRQRKGLPPKVRRLRGGLDLLLEALAAYGPIDAPPRGARALDFGCGDGKFLDRLQDRGWDTYGIEPSTNVAFLRHHRLKVPPADASFDLVVLHHVLEHVTAPLDLLQQLAGTLRDGGMLCVSVPRLDTLPEHRELQYCLDGNRHPVCFSERCLAGLLARAGCAVTAVLDQPELDTAQTEGRRVRLRIVATRTSQPLSLPAAPLAPALAALGKYRSAAEEGGSRFLHCLPVRMRGALLDRVRNPSQGKHE